MKQKIFKEPSPKMPIKIKSNQGFSILELLVVLTIASILLGVAIPSFQSTLKRNRVESHQNDLSSMLAIARSESVGRSRVVTICGSANLTSCAGSSDWSTGWIVFLDDGSGGGTASDGIRNGTEEILKVYRHQGENSLIVRDSNGNGVNAISFNARGAVVQQLKATLRICDGSADVNYARAFLLEKTGRVIRSFDRFDSSNNLGADGIYEDVNGNNLTCS